MNITLIQMESNGTRKENEEKALKFLKQAVEQKTDIICLSEKFFYWGKNRDEGKAKIEDIQIYRNFAKENKVNIILGSIDLIDENSDKTTNTCFAIDRQGNIVGRYDKKYMYVVDRPNLKIDERERTIQGNELGIVELDNVKIGIGICFDLRFPEYFRELTKNGAQIVFLPSHFRESTGSIAWDILTKARAIENQMYFCACNQTGQDLCGNSKVISFDGTIIDSLDKEEGILKVELDLKKQEKCRKEFPVLEQM